ncbi:MAG: DUF2441 domain-containing protein [Bacilli bacterium]|nr:DUF2441 domain-containing protein [Bacilli bacterium]
MNVIGEEYWHVHRLGFYDDLWCEGQELEIDENFSSNFYQNYSLREDALTKQYGSYDIDEVIKNLESIREYKDLEYKLYHAFSSLAQNLYIFRREKALEEGRKLYNPDAPSRLHAIYLTNFESLQYWHVNVDMGKVFSVDVRGQIFVSSDILFPTITADLDEQVRESKSYWQPKKLTLDMPIEYLFQGELRVNENLKI